MSNSTYIEMEDDYWDEARRYSSLKKEKPRVEDVKPEPQEEKVTPDNFKYNIGDIIKVNDPDTNLLSPAYTGKQYHDNLRVIFRFYDGNHVYIVEAEDGICLVLPEYQAELVERLEGIGKTYRLRYIFVNIENAGDNGTLNRTAEKYYDEGFDLDREKSTDRLLVFVKSEEVKED